MGFRFHGWQKQPEVKTIHDIVDKTLSFVFKHFEFKTIGTGRTDAKVSASSYHLQLFINEEVKFDYFIKEFNRNAPSDLMASKIKKCSTNYAIINAPKIKTYHYYFSFGKKQHPFAAPFMVGFQTDLKLEKMQKAAQIFKGKHHFEKYCCKPGKNTQFERIIEQCEIIENTILQANFFPKKSYILIVKGSGFLRYQIRYMMAVLVAIGKDEMSLKELKESLSKNNDKKSWHYIAPSSGLQLFDIELLNY